MALNKKSLGSAILSLEKGENSEVQSMKLSEFALVENKADESIMICFTTKEVPNKYYWASTSLHNFLTDNVENAVYNFDRDTYSFPEDEVVITHCGKTPLKNDKTRSANVWRIEC